MRSTGDQGWSPRACAQLRTAQRNAAIKTFCAFARDASASCLAAVQPGPLASHSCSAPGPAATSCGGARHSVARPCPVVRRRAAHPASQKAGGLASMPNPARRMRRARFLPAPQNISDPLLGAHDVHRQSRLIRRYRERKKGAWKGP
jgi:hypothetical protein